MKWFTLVVMLMLMQFSMAQSVRKRIPGPAKPAAVAHRDTFYTDNLASLFNATFQRKLIITGKRDSVRSAGCKIKLVDKNYSVPCVAQFRFFGDSLAEARLGVSDTMYTSLLVKFCQARLGIPKTVKESGDNILIWNTPGCFHYNFLTKFGNRAVLYLYPDFLAARATATQEK